MSKGHRFNSEPQFPGVGVDALSAAATPLELFFQNELFAHGTAFFYRVGLETYLVTCWHNLTGKNPFTGELMNVGGRTPDKIGYYYTEFLRRDRKISQGRPVRVELNLEGMEGPIWKQHVNFEDKRIDIAVICVGLAVDWPCVQDVPLSQLFSPIGSSVYILGYPFSPDLENNRYPIWKGGFIATEPVAGWDGRRACLIDAATRKGMSGSAVVRRLYGNSIALDKMHGPEFRPSEISSAFVGVYSGHLKAGQSEITLGICWHGQLVDEIIAKPALGTRF